MKCMECKREFNESENININYEGSSDFNMCGIDCMFKHVALEILSDDRSINELIYMLSEVKKIHEENL